MRRRRHDDDRFLEEMHRVREAGRAFQRAQSAGDEDEAGRCADEAEKIICVRAHEYDRNLLWHAFRNAHTEPF